MIDLLEPAQDALFAALKPLETAGGMPAGLRVFQHVPENTDPPMIIVGALSSADASDKGDRAEDITAEIQFIYRGAGRAPLLAMMRAAREALQWQVLTADGAAFEECRWIKAEAGDALADGVTYVGIQTYEFTAEPA